MRVFVTGASGFVGSAVVKELIDAGHAVTGLARSDANAAALTAMGAQPHRGSLEDLESLRAGAKAADGVIHCAFNHDFTRFVENCELDRHAIEALGDGLAGSGKPLIVTSGSALLAPGQLATEDQQAGTHIPRVSEQAGDALLARGVKAMMMRLPPSVHGDGDHGFVPRLIGFAREKGKAAYVGDGANRWPAVHRLDAAVLYRLVLEKGQAGARYHAIGDEGVPFRQIARVIGEKLGVPQVSLSKQEAEAHFGWFALFAGIDAPASGDKTKAAMDWRPRHVGLIADLEKGTYF
ncbi:MAG TPA: SDR family oxidoreductase [Rhizomicrobium sp.]|nr:SDR family oxidoreductase [Rhizomicrobium sp.]